MIQAMYLTVDYEDSVPQNLLNHTFLKGEKAYLVLVVYALFRETFQIENIGLLEETPFEQ